MEHATGTRIAARPSGVTGTAPDPTPATIGPAAPVPLPAARDGARLPHTVPVPRPQLRRTYEELSSKDTVGRLGSIPVIAKALTKNLAQGPTVQEHVERALAEFDRHLALKGRKNAFLNEAIRIATLVDATAAELARSVIDPTIKPQIAKELIAAYRTELTALLDDSRDLDGGSRRNIRALRVAEAMVSGDPVLRYMSGKVMLDDAAREIVAMAAQARLAPDRMFDTLRTRFEMELGSHSSAEIDKGRLKPDDIVQTEQDGTKKAGKGGFDLADLIGEISPEFYARVVDLQDPADTTKRTTGPRWDAAGLAMTGAAVARLDALKQAVTSTTLATSAVTAGQVSAMQDKRGKSLSDKQAEHFVRLEQEESAAAQDYEGTGASPEAYVTAHLMKRYGTDETAAKSLVRGILTALTTVPLTLTSNLDRLFAARDDGLAEPRYGSQYKSEPGLMKEDIDVSDLVGKPDRGTVVEGIGRPDDNFTESRGTNYMRWRRDKDERETGYHGLGADDLPIYGAVNPNFTTTKGGNANKAEYDHSKKGYGGVTYGANYYGDMHMVLRDSVRPRSTLIARGKRSTEGRRIERTDLMFLVADMCRLHMNDYLDAIVADALQSGRKKKQTVLHNMDAEVHVYGGLDIATDVQSIYVSQQAIKDSKKKGTPAARLKQFAEAHGIALIDIGKKPSGYDVGLKRPHGTGGGIDMTALLG